MATGPEHYRRAEEHLDAAYVASIDDGAAAYHHARAQVHATLATTDQLEATRELARIEKERADKYVDQVLELQEQLNDLIELRGAVRKMLNAAVVQDDGVWVRPDEFYAVTDSVAEDGA